MNTNPDGPSGAEKARRSAWIEPLTPEQLKAAYAKARAEFDPAEWDGFDPAEYTVPVEELVAELDADHTDDHSF
jgi:hypothetical protein